MLSVQNKSYQGSNCIIASRISGNVGYIRNFVNLREFASCKSSLGKLVDRRQWEALCADRMKLPTFSCLPQVVRKRMLMMLPSGHSTGCQGSARVNIPAFSLIVITKEYIL